MHSSVWKFQLLWKYSFVTLYHFSHSIINESNFSDKLMLDYSRTCLHYSTLVEENIIEDFDSKTC